MSMDTDAMDAESYIETNSEGAETDARGLPSSISDFFNRKVVEMPVGRYDNEYNMKHTNRGVALIFNHKLFNPRLKFNPRNGTDKDCNDFKKALEILGFTTIYVYDDYSVDKVKAKLEEVRKMDHTNNDCLLVAVLTHGGENLLYACDGPMSPEDIWKPFIGSKCLTLVGKPKLFFIQACRGDRLDSAVRVMDKTDSYSSTYKLPNYADFLIHYSNVPGYYSWRNKTEGSWFIQSLCAIFHQYGQSIDLLTLLTLVNQKVAIEFESCVPHIPELHAKKEIPCFTSMLTRKVFFLPKSIS